MTEKIIEIKYEDEMKKSYIDYAMSVITSRALPDVRDGLKPVHRRILVEMEDLKLSPTSAHRKSARIVGNVLGKLHPHGDTSVYDAMVRMSQDFNMLMPLVDGHGNFGSIDGDGAAAMRYTEARLTPIAMEFLRGLDKGIVDTKANFDETIQEPTVLPCRYPNLLVSGSSGIAVGMAASIPSHNLNEVIDASIALIDNNNLDTKGLLKYIKGPDFPTRGIVANKKDLLNIYKTGTGSVRLRGVVEIEDAQYGRKNIIVTEIPYTLAGNKTRLLEDVIKLINDKRLSEVTQISDESSKDGVRIVIELKKGVDIDNVINKLYKLTRLEDTFPVNLLAIKDGEPKVFNLQEMLLSYIEFLKEINIKELTFDLNALNSRKEVVDGLIKAVDVIDTIIETIRGSKSVKVVENCLINGVTKDIAFKTKASEARASKLKFTERQARAILAMQLQRLVGLEIEKLEKEFKEIDTNIKKIEKILSTDKSLNKYIKTDLLRIRDSYGVKRRTKVGNIEIEEIKKEKIVEEDYFALMDKFNYVKLVDEQSYTRANQDTLDGYKTTIKLRNTEDLCFFTSDGEFYKIKASDIPVCKINEKGSPIEVLLEAESMSKHREILLITKTSELKDSLKVMYVTLMGLIKQTELSDHLSTNRRNIYATKLNKKDKLIGVFLIKDSDKEVEIITEDNRGLRFNIDEVSTQGRVAKGVIGINLNIGDSVKSVNIGEKSEKDKRRRGGKGVVID